MEIVGLGTERSNPDYYALSVMNEVFSGGFGTRLVQYVRTKLGLAYDVGGSFGAGYDHPGVFRTVVGTKSATTVAATKAVLEEIGRLKTVPPTPAEMRKAKDQVMNSFIFNYDTPEKTLNEQVTLAFYGYPPDFLEKYKDGIERVTAADVSRVANKYIDVSKLAILVVGNKPQIQPPLSTLGKVTDLDITIPTAAPASLPGSKASVSSTVRPKTAFGREKIAGMEATGFAVAIMAAGKGTRLNSKRPKVLHQVGGRALLLHVIAAAKTLVPADRIYCIIGHQADRVRAAGRTRRQSTSCCRRSSSAPATPCRCSKPSSNSPA